MDNKIFIEQIGSEVKIEHIIDTNKVSNKIYRYSIYLHLDNINISKLKYSVVSVLFLVTLNVISKNRGVNDIINKMFKLHPFA
jgi:hypothetical protein